MNSCSTTTVEQADLEKTIEHLAVETSDQIILQLDIGEDDRRLSRIIDDLRDRLSAAAAPLQARIERLEAINAELLEKLGSINRLTSPGNRTFDDLCRDMGCACDIARAAIASAQRIIGGEMA